MTIKNMPSLLERVQETANENLQLGFSPIPVPNDIELLFPGHKDINKPIDLRTQFETVLKQADIDNFRWHDLRHTTASYLAMNGSSLASIAEILGHKTLSMVKRYAHLSEAHTANEVESMNYKIFGES